jgi:hypothetical protein
MNEYTPAVIACLVSAYATGLGALYDVFFRHGDVFPILAIASLLAMAATVVAAFLMEQEEENI